MNQLVTPIAIVASTHMCTSCSLISRWSFNLAAHQGWQSGAYRLRLYNLVAVCVRVKVEFVLQRFWIVRTALFVCGVLRHGSEVLVFRPRLISLTSPVDTFLEFYRRLNAVLLYFSVLRRRWPDKFGVPIVVRALHLVWRDYFLEWVTRGCYSLLNMVLLQHHISYELRHSGIFIVYGTHLGSFKENGLVFIMFLICKHILVAHICN